MKRPTTLLCSILRNAGLIADLAVERDIQEIECRYEHEGMSFLTISLPTLCDALDQGLTTGWLTPSLFKGFKPLRRGGKLPALLSGFFSQVFASDGALLSSPSIEAIAAIRQVTRAFKKVELPCSSARVKQAFDRYKDNDASVFGCDHVPAAKLNAFRLVSAHLWSELEVLSGELYCSPGRFGSGATAERYKYNERHTITEWNNRAEGSFPSSFHAVHNESATDSLSAIRFLDPHEERPVRVVTVPKTLKTPRIISVEPSHTMLQQQSVMAPLVRWLETGRLGFTCIRFSDQSVNRDMARVGSERGHLATLDLSDASDLVSLDLVKAMFKTCPTFLDYILDCRTTTAKMPDGELISLNKFASMGSALCFPIEAMYFMTIVLAAIASHSGVSRPSKKWIAKITAKISVYGDDIIVPSKTASVVQEWLEAFGLKVNLAKSFTSGFFRESCGGDYYMGHDVTPVYVRQWDFNGTFARSEVLMAYVSLSNQLYWKGLWHASQELRNHIDLHGGFGPLARTTAQVAVLTYASRVYNTGLRWCPNLHSWRVRGPAPKTRQQPDRVDGISGVLLLVFQIPGRTDEVVLERSHDWFGGPASDKTVSDFGYLQLIERSTRVSFRPIRDGLTSVTPYSVKVKSRWCPVRTGIF